MSTHYRSNLANLPSGYEMPHPQVPRQYSVGPSSPVYKTSIMNPIDYVRNATNARNNYTTDSNRTAEEEEEEEVIVFQCPECPTQCTGPHARGNMSRHMRKHKSEPKKKKDNLKCPYCESKFGRSDATRKHIRRYHPEVAIDIDDPASEVPRHLPKRKAAEIQRITNLMLQIMGYDQMLFFMSNLGDVVRYTENSRPGDQTTRGFREAFEILAAAQVPQYSMPIDGESTGTGSAEQQPLGTSSYLPLDNAGPSNSANQGVYYENPEDPGQQPQLEATNDSPPAKPGQMLFGCHVCKYHRMQGYPPTCEYEGATGLSSVIDHLRQKCHRTHIRRVSRCKICWGFYFDETGACDNDHSYLQQGERLVQPRGARQEGAWVALFLMFFPDAPAIPSPYVGDDRFVDTTNLPGFTSSRVSFLPVLTPHDFRTDDIYGALSPDDFNAPAQSTRKWSENAILLATTSSLGAIAQLLQDALLDGAIDPRFEYAHRLIRDNRGRLSETDRHLIARDIRTLTLRFMTHIHAHLDKPMSLPLEPPSDH
ncbi:hypothetical protein BU24DRAFT_26229 [Aaosphaeria arxii CBS 175.79]|uniref:C2H2-type domain-containing protein n=1 Tax=Aaosphaeria arxii CBS 175.79 TaxID=1450172 RepID=A0A6A5YAU3_9PLEO|nr:uncharacterized protein BU24DRAFT_26229 [Aaosphaeria arxii CBS 175.79]KAF2021704.1 hypothetical protein BU24DRAFT_26229 [Aaosphaeria arxii CBS 175.79]